MKDKTPTVINEWSFPSDESVQYRLIWTGCAAWLQQEDPLKNEWVDVCGDRALKILQEFLS